LSSMGSNGFVDLFEHIGVITLAVFLLQILPVLQFMSA